MRMSGDNMDNKILENLKPIALAAKNTLANLKYRFDIISTANLVDVESDEFAKKFLANQDMSNKKPDDFIILKNYLATSLPYINGNGDAFKPEDLVDVVKNGQLSTLQPAIIDWYHDFSPRGNTIGAEVVDTVIDIAGIGKTNVKQIVVYSVFYAWLFPYEADKIREWADKGILTFSMACGAEDIEWINGNNRVLIKPQFLANSIIPPDKNPADENAKLIKIAKQTIDNTNNLGEDNMDKIKELENKIKDLETALKDKEKVIADLTKSELSKENESLKQELDAVKAEKDSLEKEKDELVKANEKEVAELKTKIDALSASVEELKASNEKYSAKIIEMNKEKLEEINKARKEKLAEFISDEEKLGKWYEKYEAKLSDDGEILTDNGFDEFVSVLEETSVASKKDVDPSDKVTASKKTVPPNNVKGDGKLLKSWA